MRQGPESKQFETAAGQSKRSELNRARSSGTTPSNPAKRRFSQARSVRVVGVLGLSLLASVAPACADFDTTRNSPKRGTVGEEMFGVICDRVGAQALREDLTGASFQNICHKPATKNGKYADEVDANKLPPIDQEGVNEKGERVSVDAQRKARDVAIGRVEALARRRTDLIRALDATFPETTLPIKDLDNADETKSCDSPRKKSEGLLTEQIADMLGRMTDLYNDGTIPDSTQSLARVIQAFDKDQDAQDAWARLSARQGYRPVETSLGAARPLVAYPHLRDLSNATLRLLSADSQPYQLDPKRDASGRRIPVAGPGNDALNKLLEAGHEELLALEKEPKLAPLVVKTDAAGRPVLSRARDNIEVLQHVLFASDPAFGGGNSNYIVRRDARGYAAISDGAVPAPFVDSDKDGLPDVDATGRFKTANGSIAPSPFPFPGEPNQAVARDAAGRVQVGSRFLYDYLDTSHTFAAQAMSDMRPLLNPNPADKHETLMDMLGGARVAVGPRKSTSKTYPGGAKVQYEGIDADSPMLDLVYALGVVLSDRNSETTLGLGRELFVSKERTMARVTGATMTALDLAQKHPEAKVPSNALFWDEALDTMGKIAREPGLLEDILKALADPRTAKLGSIFSRYMNVRDDVSYDRADINGTPWNRTTNSKSEMVTPVDRTKPETGANRSAFYRFLQIIQDTRGVTACNQEDAKVHALGLSLPFNFPECGVYKIDDLAAFYLDAIVNAAQYDDTTPKRGTIYMRNGLLRNAPGIVNILQDSSGITGMRDAGFNVVAPTPNFLNRLVFFDQRGDTQNPKTKTFVSDLQGEFIGTSVCPERIIDDPVPDAPNAAPDGKIRGLRSCANGDWLQQRDKDTLFTWENYGFYTGIDPLLTAFVKHRREDLFLDLATSLYKHWPGSEGSKDECRLVGNATCPRAGFNTYSALLTEVLAGDVFPAAVELAKALENLPIKHCEEVSPTTKECSKVLTVSGIDVAAAATRSIVDSEYSKANGLKDRKGRTTARRNDGSSTPVTPAYLITNALRAIDAAFDTYEKEHPDDKDRRANWRRARSQLADQFLGVKTAQSVSVFANPGVPKMAPVLVDLLRGQLTAHCPQSFTPPYAKCTWASEELTKKAQDILTGPLAAAGLDMMEAIRADEGGRTEIERLAQYLLDPGSKNAALANMLASTNDVAQMLRDDENLIPLARVVAAAMDASTKDAKGRVTQKSLVDAQMALLARVSGRYFDKDNKEICRREVDPNQVLAVALGNLVTPMNDGDLKGQSPIEVIIDVVADVNRVDPAQKYEGTLNRSDYASVSKNAIEFLTDKERGLEQFYEVIRKGTQ